MGPIEIIEVIAFAICLLIFVIRHLDSRLPVAAALATLVTIAILIVLENEAMVNRLAIYAFYLLVMGTILRLVEYSRGKQKG